MTRAIHWFRNDLRLRDNTALVDASSADELALVFVLDPRLLGDLRSPTPRTRFLLDSLRLLAEDLPDHQELILRRGKPEREIPKLLRETGAELLTWNRDTSPFARRRDERVAREAEKLGARVLARKDRVAFEAGELTKADGLPYVVYTPYAKKWFESIRKEPLRPKRVPRLPAAIPGLSSVSPPSIRQADRAHFPAGSRAGRRRLHRFVETDLADYATDRDRPDLNRTSRLSPHLRFGTLSVRDCLYTARDAMVSEGRLRNGGNKWIGELIWRDFYAGILESWPSVLDRSFQPAYDNLAWLNDEREFSVWKAGRTGFPIVDAGMRQLLETGWMHNRVRMVVASFLAKDLLIDWRWGEAHFWATLVDGDPGSNNGGWQWAASTGTDAQPYFRIFNPTNQGLRFDPEGTYVRRWVPELSALRGKAAHEPWKSPLAAPDYPPPIVDHRERRRIAIEAFKSASAGLSPRPARTESRSRKQR